VSVSLDLTVPIKNALPANADEEYKFFFGDKELSPNASLSEQGIVEGISELFVKISQKQKPQPIPKERKEEEFYSDEEEEEEEEDFSSDTESEEEEEEEEDKGKRLERKMGMNFSMFLEAEGEVSSSLSEEESTKVKRVVSSPPKKFKAKKGEEVLLPLGFDDSSNGKGDLLASVVHKNPFLQKKKVVEMGQLN
jgi:hypothetical protein